MAPLKKILESLKIESEVDYRELGSAIAERQEDPPRYIPYNGFTVQGWARGELLPTPAAEEALRNALETQAEIQRIDIEKEWEIFSNSVEVARDNEAAPETKYAPTELSHALLKAKDTLGLKYREIAAKARERNTRRPGASLPGTESIYHYLLRGAKTVYPIKFQTMFFQELLNSALHDEEHPRHEAVRAAGFDNKTLLRLHEQALRERGDILWQEAVRENNLGDMLKAIRVRRGDSQATMGKQLGEMTEDLKPFTGAAVNMWENGINPPIGHRQQSGETLFEPYVKLAKLTDKAPNALARSIAQPWFTPDKETALREAFTAMISQKSRQHYEQPPSSPVALPPSKEIAPGAKVTQATLTNIGMRGRSGENIER